MKRFNDFLTELNRFEKEKGTDTKTGNFHDRADND